MHVVFDMFAHVPHRTLGTQKVTLENVELHNIRRRQDKQMVELPRRKLRLSVAKGKPDLTIDGKDFRQFFVVPTPAPGTKSPVVQLELSKDRREAKADVGPSVLHKMSQSSVTGKNRHVGKYNSDFEFELDGAGTHKLEITGEKKSIISVSSKPTPVTLKVDDKVMVQCLPSEAGGESAKGFDMSFRFLGMRKLIFKVFEEDGSGYSVDTQREVEKPMVYGHRVRIVAPDVNDLSQAMLYIDEKAFSDLPMEGGSFGGGGGPTNEPVAAAPRDVFEKMYHIDFPHAMKSDASTGLMPTGADFTKMAAGGDMGCFAACCNGGSVDSSHDIDMSALAQPSGPQAGGQPSGPHAGGGR